MRKWKVSEIVPPVAVVRINSIIIFLKEKNEPLEILFRYIYIYIVFFSLGRKFSESVFYETSIFIIYLVRHKCII